MKRLGVCLFALAIPAVALAQSADEPPVHATQMAIGGGLFGGVGLGADGANLRANATAPRDYRLFDASTRVTSTPILDVRVTIGLSRRVDVEWHTMYARPVLKSSLGADVEGAPGVTVGERIDRFVIEGSVLLDLDRFRVGRRTVPFVAGGAGYLRQLHEGKTLIEQGLAYHAGGGIRHWLLVRDHGLIRATGVRADARVYLLDRNVALHDRLTAHGVFSGDFIVAF